MYILAALIVATLVAYFMVPGWAGQADLMYRGLRGRLKLRTDTRELARQFKDWASKVPPHKRGELSSSAEAFAGWLGVLSDKDLEDFTRRVARFCASLKFDLAWLYDEQVSREPELRKAVEDAVLLYSLAVWRATTVQQDVEVFLRYQAWVAHPNRHAEFGDKLHRALVERGLLSVPTELYLSPEKERRAQAVAAVQKAAEDDQVAFREVLRSVAGITPPTPELPPAKQTNPSRQVATSSKNAVVPASPAMATTSSQPSPSRA